MRRALRGRRGHRRLGRLRLAGDPRARLRRGAARARPRQPGLDPAPPSCVSVIGVTMRAERWRTLFPRESRPRLRADVLGLAGRPARQQRAAAARRRARARARALPRVGPAAHRGARDGRRRARLRPGRHRGAPAGRSPGTCPTRPWPGASRCSRSRSWRSRPSSWRCSPSRRPGAGPATCSSACRCCAPAAEC